MIHKRSTALERSIKNVSLKGFNQFHGANLTLSSDIPFHMDKPNSTLLKLSSPYQLPYLTKVEIFNSGLPRFQKKICPYPNSRLYISRCGVEGLDKNCKFIVRGRERETYRHTDRQTDRAKGIEMS